MSSVQSTEKATTSSNDEVTHYGSCHCGEITWKLRAPKILKCIICNCSICKKKSNTHFIAERSKFELLQGEEFITTYTFNTHKAKHTFCKKCGVQSFYTPRSNPDSVGVMPHCIDSETVEKIEISTFDGQNWEKEMLIKAPVAYK